jgi:hypothetical protein
MSAYQMVVHTVYREVDLAAFKARLWTWWVGLYAEPPRRLRPMI